MPLFIHSHIYSSPQVPERVHTKERGCCRSYCPNVIVFLAYRGTWRCEHASFCVEIIKRHLQIFIPLFIHSHIHSSPQVPERVYRNERGPSSVTVFHLPLSFANSKANSHGGSAVRVWGQSETFPCFTHLFITFFSQQVPQRVHTRKAPYRCQIC